MHVQFTIRAVRYAAYGVGAMAVLLVAAALALPVFLDTPAVERELKARLSQLAQGEVAWEDLSIRLLPTPRGALVKARVEIPGIARVRAEQIDAHLRLWPLLQGRAEIAAVRLEKPVVRIRIAPSEDAAKKEETAADPTEGQRKLLETIRELLPEAVLGIDDGEVEIDLEGYGLVRARELQLRVESRAEGKARLETDVDLRAEVEVVRGTELVQIPRVAIRGRAIAGEEDITVDGVRAKLGASRLSGGGLRYGLRDRVLASSTDFDLALAEALDATRRLLPEEAAKALARLQPVSGKAQGQATFAIPAEGWNATVNIRKSDSSIGVEGLPGPVKVSAGSVTVTGKGVKIERVDVAMLDARALASATIDYEKRLRFDGAVSEGSVGEGALDWAWKSAGAPPHVKLKTPIRVTVQRAAWGPEQALEVVAAAAFDSGPGVSVDLSWTPKALYIRRATVKDAKSDSTHSLRLEKDLAEGDFSGSLHSETIGAALKQANVPSGSVSGDFRFRVDLANPGKGTASGKLRADSVDLGWLVGRPFAVERVDAVADGQKLVVREASVNWAEQRFALSGTLTRAPDGAPVIDAQIESPGVKVDALLPRSDEAPHAPAPKKPAPAASDEPLWDRWPLPVRGHIGLRAKFIQYGERKAEPVVVALTLEERRAGLEIREAQLCGISFPLTAEAKPKGQLAFSVKLTASKQQVEQTARCLTERGVQMTGEFDLRADLRAQGTRRELLRNLQGTVQAEARNGRVRQFPLILKILSVRDVAESLKRDGVSLEDAGFPYLSITAKGRFDQGRFIADESAFRSNSVGFAASGSVSLIGDPPKPYDTQLTVLVAPLSRLDSLVRDLPLLGYVVGGTLTSWPVRVTEDIRDPHVEAVSPEAIGTEFIGMFQRTLKLPEKLLPKFGR